MRTRLVELRADDDPQRLREKLARIVLDEMYQFVGLLDTEGTLLEVNRAALVGGGIQEQDILGKPFCEAHWWTVSPQTQQQLRDAIARAALGEFVRYDVEVFGGAGGRELVVIDFSLIPVTDPDGAVVFLVPEGRNITEKKRAEAEIARKNEELGRLLERVQELDELKSQFFANVSHELRTPLALVLGPVENLLATARNLTPDQRRDLEVVRRNATSLLKHVSDLLDVAKLAAAKADVCYRELDLAALVRFVDGHFAVLAPERSIQRETSLPPALAVQADPDKLERVVTNLLSNAYKFTPPGGSVSVSLYARDNRAILEVRDTGPGVKPELREVIFERFRQGEGGSTRQFGGTGLGLAIAKDFVELHGGSIAVADAPGGGALFRVELPLRAPASAKVLPADRSALQVDAVLQGTLQELRPVPAPGPAELTGAPGGLVALVIEDNPEMSRFIGEVLAAEFSVTTVLDGRAGLERALAQPPDLVVTDVMMPGLSGDQLVLALRGRPELDGVPILVLSAKADGALRVRLLEQGAQDYVVKPFSTEELLARARNLVQIERVRKLLRAELASRETDLEQLALELTANRRELAMALDAMRIARDAAEQAGRAKAGFLSMVSHELRTPLTIIQLQLDRLERAPAESLSPEHRRRFARITGANQRLLHLVDSLLEYSRVDANRLSPSLDDIDMRALLDELVEEFAPVAEEKALSLSLAGPHSLRWVSDRNIVQLILRNLVSNAIKYTDRGTVEVSAAVRDGSLAIAVRDTGKGIAPEDRTRVFEAFEQLEVVRHKHLPGVGLGLALVRRAVEALGGRIELASELGAGSTFTVLLPARALPPSTRAPPPGAQSARRTA